jgi:hypothetical protein
MSPSPIQLPRSSFDPGSDPHHDIGADESFDPSVVDSPLAALSSNHKQSPNSHYQPHTGTLESSSLDIHELSHVYQGLSMGRRRGRNLPQAVEASLPPPSPLLTRTTSFGQHPARLDRPDRLKRSNTDRQEVREG